MTSGLGLPPSPARGGAASPLSAIRKMRKEDDEFCELCHIALRRAGHRHLLEPGTRTIKCACTACGMLFPREAQKRFVLIPQRNWHLTDFQLDDGEWDSLAIPVGMAYLYTTAVADTTRGRPEVLDRGGIQGVKAFYPGPAGATESLLSMEGWDELIERNPILSRIEPDVEALLVDRVGEHRDYYIVPIDTCYELVGLIRFHWRGLSGGSEAWEKFGGFFTNLKKISTEKRSHA